MESSQKPDYAERIHLVRIRMAEKNLSGLIVRGTDRYLNEYVPENESTRAWLSGFTGSAGELFITWDKAFLFVDGRYYLQADQQADPKIFEAVRVPLGTSLDKSLIQKISDLWIGRSKDRNDLFPKSGARIGFEPDRFSIEAFKRLKEGTEKLNVEWVPLLPSIVETVRGPVKEKTGKIWQVSLSLTGLTVDQKLGHLRDIMKSHGIHLWIVQTLDEIAYLTNLRGNEIAYQTTFKSLLIVTPDQCYVALPKPERSDLWIGRSKDRTGQIVEKELTFIEMDQWEKLVAKMPKTAAAGYDPSTTTESIRLTLISHGLNPVLLSSPIAKMKAVKTPEELAHMMKAFERADQVVHRAKQWLCRKVAAGEKITEGQFAERVAKLFKQSGAIALSFHIISAAGKNGAVIHYSTPDPDRIILNGELMLLDTGAYYEGGYATDLTRTFLAGGSKTKGTDEQRKFFTLVLKGAVAGMEASFPKGTSGAVIDTLVRAPIWKAGYNYNHGTGHGVGINVHESPPRLSPFGSDVLDKGHVFSIEPGLYLPEFGGVRIENLCTVIDHPKYPGWLMVVPLTFSPLDDRLIDPALLTAGEKKWLKWYKNQFKITHAAPPCYEA